jgi:hypothetical protein
MAKLLTRRLPRKSGLILGAMVALLGTGWASAANAQAVQVAQGEAFGTDVQLLGAITSNKTASVGMCTTQPENNTNIVAGANLPGVLTAGAITTNARRENLPGGLVRARTKASIAEVSVVAGLITINGINAVSITESTPTGLTVSPGGSHLASVSLLGVPLSLNPGPNTVLDVLGVATLTLNEQTQNIFANGATHRTRMVHLTVNLPNLLGLPVGADISIGSASSGIVQTPVLLGGGAYGANATVGTLAVIDRLARVGMPCAGTGGATILNATTGINIPGILQIGGIESTIMGDANPLFVNAVAKSKVAGLNLLGLVTADVLKARVTLAGTPLAPVGTTEGTQLVGLQVAGFPAINDFVAENTMVPLLGLGELWLKRRVNTPAENRVQMRLIELSVLEANALGLPIGANVRVAFAQLFSRVP